MNTQLEQILIKKFIVKDKQDRYLGFVNKDKTRKKFIMELHYLRDFNWDLFCKTGGNEFDILRTKIESYKNISSCYIISENSKIDGLTVSVIDAIEKYRGYDGTILVFGEAEVVYYEGEAPFNRYISI